MKTTIESGELQSAVAKWQLEFESEAHGKYIYTTSEEKTEEITYERHFAVILALFIHLYNHLHAIQHLLFVTNISNKRGVGHVLYPPTGPVISQAKTLV